jgi:meiosis induction protein kinase IME2/SME1
MASLGGLLNKVSIGSNSSSNASNNNQSSSPVGWDSFLKRGGGHSAAVTNAQPQPVPQPPPPIPVTYYDNRVAGHAQQHSPAASSSTAASPSSANYHSTTNSSTTSMDTHRRTPSSFMPGIPIVDSSLYSQARAFPPPLEPRSYTILKEVGDGSFGTVWLADWHSPLRLPPGTTPPGPSSRPEYKGKKLVAVKRMKKAVEGGWEECLKLKELRVSAIG